ncbi:MAG: carboxypeptidase regulatory-like domain-containing protein [Planctomycetes bacterium]|nr:carboxypeptidase regulatory-like domain-containing protein [Planctomycetota bacterium]
MKRTKLGSRMLAIALVGALGLLLWLTQDGAPNEANALRADPAAKLDVAESNRSRHERSADDAESSAGEVAAPLQAPEPTLSSDRAALEIEVVLRESSSPLPHVGIVVRPTDGVDPFLEMRRGTSGADGRCRFEDLRPGRWTIALDRGDERQVELSGGALQSERFEIAHTGELRGIVIDAERKPVPNAAIWLGRGRHRWYRQGGHAQFVTTSDAEGRFHIRGLPRELHLVGASASPYVPSDFKNVEVAMECAEVEIVLSGRCGALRGRIVDELGASVADAQIWCGERFGWLSSAGQSFEGPAARQLQSDAAGRFELIDLPTGPARVLARKEGYAPAAESVEISPGETAELTLVMKQGCALRGRVQDDGGKAVAGARIEIFGAARFEEAVIVSDATGQFACLDFAPGLVQVQVSADGFVDRRDVLNAAPGSELQLEAVLQRSLSISGHLVDEEGQGLVGWGVTTTGADRRICATQTQESGSFELTPLAPGSYELSAFSEQGRPVLAFPDLGRIQAGSRELLLRIPRGAFSASLRGRLIDATGSALEGVWVWCRTDLWPSEPCRTKSDGNFEFRDLAAGDYQLETRDMRYPSLRRAGIALAQGAALDLGDVSLPACGTLLLEARCAGDFDPEQLFVELHSQHSPPRREHGRFEKRSCVLHLEPGTYELVTYGNGVVSESARVNIMAGGRKELAIEVRRGVERQLVFPDPAPAWWHEAPSFRAELLQRDGNLRLTHEWEADDLWPFSWCPCLVPGTYDLRVESPGRPTLVGSFVLDSLRRTPQPIRIATRELR